MPISCIPVSLYPDFRSGNLTNAKWIKLGAEAGLDGVDFNVSLPAGGPEGPGEIRRQLEDAGLQGVMVVGHQDFTHPDPEKRRQEIEQAIKWVKMAAALGCPYVRTTVSQDHPELSRQQGIDLAVAGMNEVAQVAIDLGVTSPMRTITRAHSGSMKTFPGPTTSSSYPRGLRQGAPESVNFRHTATCPVFNNEDPFLALLEKVAPRPRDHPRSMILGNLTSSTRSLIGTGYKFPMEGDLPAASRN